MGAFSNAFTGLSGGGSDGSFTADDRANLAAIAARIATGNITVQSPVSATGETIRIMRGDDYAQTEARQLDFASADWPILDGTVFFKLGSTTRVAAVITGSRAVRVELMPSHTSSLKPDTYPWQLEATQSNGHVITLVSGNLILAKDL